MPSPAERPAAPERTVTIRHLALVWLGGTLGCGLRAALGLCLAGSGAFPLSTWLVNIVGSTALGYLLETLRQRGPDTGVRRDVRLFAGTGFLGGFTTYSSFSVDAIHLIHDGELFLAASYIGGTIAIGALAAYAGIVLAKRTVGS